MLASGEIAVLASEGIALFDRKLAPVASIARGPATRARRLVPLSDERFVVHDEPSSDVFVGARGGALEKVEAGIKSFDSVAATASGFVATSRANVLVDVRGERKVHELPERARFGALSFGNGAIVAGDTGFVLIDENGTLNRHELALAAKPIAAVDLLLLPTREDVASWRDGNIVARLPIVLGDGSLAPFANGILHTSTSEVAFYRVDGEPTRVWSRTIEDATPSIAGDFVILGGFGTSSAWIVDREGNEITKLDLDGSLGGAALFGDGIAIRAQHMDRIVWWRPDAETISIEHDDVPSLLVSVADGILTCDRDMLCVWNATEQGPEPPAITTSIPFNAPIVVDGRLVTLRGPGRFALRGVDARGQRVALAPDAKFRPATTREEATKVLQSMLERRTAGALPDLSWDRPAHELRSPLADLPLAQTASLQTRALFAPAKLARGAQWAASLARAAFFEELANAFDVTPRVISAAVRAGQFPLEPPQKIAGFEYIGSFTTSGALTVADPCYLGRSKTAYPLSFSIDAREGRWHAFLRPAEGEPHRTAEIVVVHERGFDVFASDPLGNVGVDSGLAGVFDKAAPRPKNDDPPLEEGIVGGLAAVASAGHGDGFYPAFTGSKTGKISKVRIHFLGPGQPEIDITAPRDASATTTARPFLATETFAVGESITHKKFGTGTVVRDLGSGKIEVSFGGETRVLVHGLK